MRAFNNDTAIKEKYLARVKAHYLADEITKGFYWKGGKGCAVGCTLHSRDHEAYETELGIPRIIARLEDCIFESLPNDIAKEFPVKFLEVIPVGADLSMVGPKFMRWILVDEKDGVLQFTKSAQTKKVIKDIAKLYQRKIKGEDVDINEWMEARTAANAADTAAYVTATAAAAAYAAAYATVAAAATPYATIAAAATPCATIDAHAAAYATVAADAAAYATATAHAAAAAHAAAYATVTAAATPYATAHAAAAIAATDAYAAAAAAATLKKARVRQSEKLLELLAGATQ